MNLKGEGNCEHKVWAEGDMVLLANNDDTHYVQEFNSWDEIEAFISEIRLIAKEVFKQGDL